MAGTTPVYGLRYAELGDPPDGAALGKNLADDVEAELDRIDTAAADTDSRVTALEGGIAYAAANPVPGTSTMNNPTSPTVLSDATTRTQLTIAFEKQSAGSVLEVHLSASVFLASGVQQNMYAGLRIDGTDYMFAMFRPNSDAPARAPITGSAVLDGIPAGTLTIEPVVSAGPSLLNLYAGGDFFHYTVREVKA